MQTWSHIRPSRISKQPLPLRTTFPVICRHSIAKIMGTWTSFDEWRMIYLHVNDQVLSCRIHLKKLVLSLAIKFCPKMVKTFCSSCTFLSTKVLLLSQAFCLSIVAPLAFPIWSFLVSLYPAPRYTDYSINSQSKTFCHNAELTLNFFLHLCPSFHPPTCTYYPVYAQQQNEI